MLCFVFFHPYRNAMQGLVYCLLPRSRPFAITRSADDQKADIDRAVISHPSSVSFLRLNKGLWFKTTLSMWVIEK